MSAQLTVHPQLFTCSSSSFSYSKPRYFSRSNSLQELLQRCPLQEHAWFSRRVDAAVGGWVHIYNITICAGLAGCSLLAIGYASL